MSKKQNNLKDESAQDAGKTYLDENELESVSGGLTIFDLECVHRWFPVTCIGKFGKCPHLSMILVAEIKTIDGICYGCYSVSCTKGYFSNKEYNEDNRDLGL